MHLDGLEEQFFELVGNLLLGAGELVAAAEAPVAADLGAAVVPHQRVPGGELLDALEQRVLVGNEAQRRVVPQGGQVRLGVDQPGSQDGFDLAGE